MIQQMRKHLDDKTKARKAVMANYYAWASETVAAAFLFSSWLMANEGDMQLAGELCIYGIIALAVGGVFICRHAWLTTLPPEEPNI